jgi:hypothetical protein
MSMTFYDDLWLAYVAMCREADRIQNSTLYTSISLLDRVPEKNGGICPTYILISDL